MAKLELNIEVKKTIWFYLSVLSAKLRLRFALNLLRNKNIAIAYVNGVKSSETKLYEVMDIIYD